MILLDRFVDRARAAGGRVGAVVIAPDGSEVLALDPDRAFRAASVIKIALVMTLFADAAEGTLSLEERVAVGARVDGSGVLSGLKDVGPMSLRDLATLAMAVSDNTATNRLIERVGLARVNERLAEWGCRVTRLARAMYDLEAKKAGRENVMTPRETASLLRRVLDGSKRGEVASAATVDLLLRNTEKTRLGRYLPAGVSLAHKDGWDEGIDNDTGIVRAREDVIVVALTNGVPTLVARPLIGLLGLAAAELAGADVSAGLPLEEAGTR
ncbi:MAG: serine hydrolase [Chloroflexi bacterium]|nr:serine hydrolase [Chloroflexota bacterium]